MSIPPIKVDNLDLSIQNLDMKITSHPLIIILSTLTIISLLIHIVYFSISLFDLFKKRKKSERVGSRTDLFVEQESPPPMVDPTKSSYLRL